MMPAVWLLTAALCLPLEAPKVVETSPKTGDQQVDPALKELRVVFDGPMNREGGYSVVGGGERFPTIVGKPRWIDDRTFLCRIRLKPDHDYQLGINGGRFLNFRGAQGESSVPYPIRFHTRPGAEISRDGLNREAVEVLREAIDQDYSYRDLHKVDWDAAFRAATPKLVGSATAEEFAREASSLIAPAKDLHFYFKAGSQYFAPPLPAIARNYDRKSLEKEVPGFSPRGDSIFAGKFDDGITYLMISTWENERARGLEEAYKVLADADASKGLIVDVRPNGGGNENLAANFAGCFIDAPKLYSRHEIRSGGKFQPARDRKVGPNRAKPGYRGKVVVLMGPNNVSSCESFLMMMKQVPGCLLVGERSRGSSGNPQPIDLGNGVTALVPSWRDLLPDGTCLEGVGIAPDVEVRADPKVFAEKDPVLQAALKKLRGS